MDALIRGNTNYCQNANSPLSSYVDISKKENEMKERLLDKKLDKIRVAVFEYFNDNRVFDRDEEVNRTINNLVGCDAVTIKKAIHILENGSMKRFINFVNSIGI